MQLANKIERNAIIIRNYAPRRALTLKSYEVQRNVEQLAVVLSEDARHLLAALKLASIDSTPRGINSCY